MPVFCGSGKPTVKVLKRSTMADLIVLPTKKRNNNKKPIYGEIRFHRLRWEYSILFYSILKRIIFDFAASDRPVGPVVELILATIWFLGRIDLSQEVQSKDVTGNFCKEKNCFLTKNVDQVTHNRIPSKLSKQKNVQHV